MILTHTADMLLEMDPENILAFSKKVMFFFTYFKHFLLPMLTSFPGEYQLVRVIITYRVAKANIRWNIDQLY